jgi:chemotaxis protein CheZ
MTVHEMREQQDDAPLGQTQFADFMRFVTRRFDEISAEINANTQLLDAAENGIARKFAEVLSILSAVGYQGTGASAHNVGMELSAVVRTTEDATIRILDSAEAINALLGDPDTWGDPARRAAALAAMAARTQDILQACAFQDLTGQRIGRTLENIRKAEAELADTLRRLGINIDIDPAALRQSVESNAASTQDEIDQLF